MRRQRISQLIVMLLIVVSTFSTSFLIYITSINPASLECPYLMESRCSKLDNQLEFTPPPPFSFLDQDSIPLDKSQYKLTNQSRMAKLLGNLFNYSSLYSRFAYSSQKLSSEKPSFLFSFRNSYLSQSLIFNSSLSSGPLHSNVPDKNTFRLPQTTTAPPVNITAILYSIPDVDFVDHQQHSNVASEEMDPFDFTDLSLRTELSFAHPSCPQFSALNLSAFPQQRFHRVGPGARPSGPFFLHAAFVDHRADFVVRVVGLAEHGSSRRATLECLLFYGSLRVNATDRSRVVRLDAVERSGASFDELPENKGKRYFGARVNCGNRISGRLPLAVSIVDPSILPKPPSPPQQPSAVAVHLPLTNSALGAGAPLNSSVKVNTSTLSTPAEFMSTATTSTTTTAPPPCPLPHPLPNLFLLQPTLPREAPIALDGTYVFPRPRPPRATTTSAAAKTTAGPSSNTSSSISSNSTSTSSATAANANFHDSQKGSLSGAVGVAPSTANFTATTTTTTTTTTSSPETEPQQVPEQLFAGRRRDRFAVCVTPFNLEYEKPRRLLEMIEMNRLLGAQHIFFYNYTLGRRSGRLVEEYARARFALRNESVPFGVTLVQWPVPVQVHVWPPRSGHVEEVHYFAQASFLHDCLMRATRRFEYLVFTDLDEFVVPRAHDMPTWDALYERHFPHDPAAFFYVRNSFYKLEFSSDPHISQNLSIRALDVELLLKTKRENVIWTSSLRSKYVLYADAVDLLGTHTVYSYTPAFHSGHLVFGGRARPPNDTSLPLVARFAPGRAFNVPMPVPVPVPVTHPAPSNGSQAPTAPPAPPAAAAAEVVTAPIRARTEFSPDTALLHHYRNWETRGDVNFVQDDYLPSHFSDPLLRRVAAVRRRFPDLFL